MKIIFFGSDDFATAHMEALKAGGHEILACVTSPDKPRGRGLQVTPSPVKEFAVRNKLPVFQPENIKDQAFLRAMKEFNCDLFVVIAYGRILPAELLQVPYVCAINVHGSLLPKYRGAAPINWAVINGETETGVTIIKMNAAMDGGDIFAQARISIGARDTSQTLRAGMIEAGKKLLVGTIKDIEDNNYTLTVQDSHAVTLAPKLTKELGLIRWDKPAVQIHNLVRGLLPWPAAYMSWGGKIVKVLESRLPAVSAGGKPPGEVIAVSPEGLLVATGQGNLLVTAVQPESGKPMDARSFAAGHRIAAGSRF
ncbi:MAG: methionyl-tRNA formyltransferase [Candidatus Omnitrophota bacterium]|nr:methionyl-tRNA formyltransferase [Candidatus Omnitrophota bacterium]MDZ4241256.1 methionyl-tRNA formyltransferase [Candidatus Omnitrophota bacterium]